MVKKTLAIDLAWKMAIQNWFQNFHATKTPTYRAKIRIFTSFWGGHPRLRAPATALPKKIKLIFRANNVSGR